MLSTTSNRQARVYCTKTTRAYNEDNAEWEEGARTHRETTSIALLVSFLMIQEDSSSHSLSHSLSIDYFLLLVFRSFWRLVGALKSR
jgi:hypothetical protein